MRGRYNMKLRYFSRIGAAAVLALIPSSAYAETVPAPKVYGDIQSALMNGTWSLDARYRFEAVDQDKLADKARASTLRTRGGYVTGSFEGFKLGVELQNLSAIGTQRYNNTYNGKATYPVVADPQDTDIDIHQLYLSNEGAIPASTVKIGRQVISLDNQRFVGPVEWRQNGQTFDAATFSSQYIPHASFYYAYVTYVNRVYGDDAPAGANVGHFDSNSHLINASYEFDPALKLTAYSYLLSFDNAPALSSNTYGGRLTGKHAINQDMGLLYTAEAANQKDGRRNPAHYSENYFLLEPGATYADWTGKIGYQVMQGNGVAADAFQTPLATLHAFNGWAEKFLSTPANGLEDKYVSVGYKVPFGAEWLKGTEATAVYHRFDAQHVSGAYGAEWDGSLSQTFFKRYTVGLTLADYNAAAASAVNTTVNTTKATAWAQIKF